jgi:ABC transporter DrrB family efflux protein
MVVFGSVAATAIGVAEDMQRGIMDRFRSLPMTSSSILLGRQVSEMSRNVVAIVVMVVAGLLVGFRFQGGLLVTLAGFGLLLLFGFAFSWIAALIGLTVRSAQAAQSAGLVWLFPFVFLSSAFVPTATLPGWLRVIAENSPITAIVNTLRAWFGGQMAGSAAWVSLAWVIGLTAVFMPLSIARFSRRDM